MKAHIRLYDDLNEYLPPVYRGREITFECFQMTTLKEMIESLNVPLSVIDLILVNGESASLKDALKENDRISVYPYFEEIEVGSDVGKSTEENPINESARFLAG